MSTYEVLDTGMGFLIAWETKSVDGKLMIPMRSRRQWNKPYLELLSDALNKEPTSMLYLVTLRILCNYEFAVV